jgi:DNA-binding NtrC family response regulator
MGGKVIALLVGNQETCFQALQAILEKLEIDTRRTRSCVETLPLLAGADPPHLVFTDTQLPDGTWADLLRLSAKARGLVKVIVVSRVVDIALYLDVLDAGGFDFVVPPFYPAEVAHIVRCATQGGLDWTKGA